MEIRTTLKKWRTEEIHKNQSSCVCQTHSDDVNRTDPSMTKDKFKIGFIYCFFISWYEMEVKSFLSNP